MATINATQDAEVTYLTGVTSTGTIAPTSFWTWNNEPATYGATSGEAKWGALTSGTGATIAYAFDPSSNWTPTEQAAFAATMTLWSAFANVMFANVGSTASAQVVIGRATDGTAEGGSQGIIRPQSEAATSGAPSPARSRSTPASPGSGRSARPSAISAATPG